MQLKHRSVFSTYFFGLFFAINILNRCFNQKPFVVRIFFLVLSLCFIGTKLTAQQQLSQSKAERLYQKGTELVAHANYGAARKVFTEFLDETTSTDPRRGEAEYYVAFSAL